jgi:hypothetical protein
MLLLLLLLHALATGVGAVLPPAGSPLCGLNGDIDPAAAATTTTTASAGGCACHAGWRGLRCSTLDARPAPARPAGGYGLADPLHPTWGGGAVYDAERQRWHVIVGARAVASANDSVTDYPCDSQIVRAVSRGADPGGPFDIAETLFHRTSWEPSLARNPLSGELVLMFFGNLSAAIPAVGSAACAIPSDEFNLTTTGTYITASPSGRATGPWSEPRLVAGMENWPGRRPGGPYSWRCASGNPGPAFHPNGSLYAAMRQNPCWKGFQTREHIGLWRADGGWAGQWTLTNPDAPLYGWGGGSERDCTDRKHCPSHEECVAASICCKSPRSLTHAHAVVCAARTSGSIAVGASTF